MDQGIRVLIADDGIHSRNGLRALLASLPAVHVVREASDGQEAVRWVEDAQPDVVLMDVRMPKLDGLGSTRLIKRKWPQIKVVVLTLYATYLAEAMAAGADSFLFKGCPTEELLNALGLDGQGASVHPQGYKGVPSSNGTPKKAMSASTSDGSGQWSERRKVGTPTQPRFSLWPMPRMFVFIAGLLHRTQLGGVIIWHRPADRWLGQTQCMLYLRQFL